jgi:hypothetical protein
MYRVLDFQIEFVVPRWNMEANGLMVAPQAKFATAMV